MSRLETTTVVQQGAAEGIARMHTGPRSEENFAIPATPFMFDPVSIFFLDKHP
jgi:hypothetical protein